MHEIAPPVDRAILVAVPRRGSSDDGQADEHLLELGRLVDTAGAQVVDRLVQRVADPSPRYYLGAGKVAELAKRVEQHNATLAIFDEELSPAQGKNLEAELKVRVMDRAELILDIFATRARSNEARLQVELAQLQYMLPRLARMWVHLSRIRGGIGLRGPGETQIETDRRMIRRKISKLKGKLESVARHRDTVRKGRREILTAALIGYTNAGKSSLLRALTGADTLIEDRLFATLDTKTRETFVMPNGKVRLVDTVGFIRKLPHHLVASFRATLEEAAFADVMLHVVDAAHPDWEEHVDVVDRVIEDLDLESSQVIHVFNKIDLLSDRTESERWIQARFPEAIMVSAGTGDVAALKSRLTELVRSHSGVRAFPIPSVPADAPEVIAKS